MRGLVLTRKRKKDLNSLVIFNEDLVLRYWDGKKPVSLVACGVNSIRTERDATEDNNLSSLPNLAVMAGSITK